MAIDMSENHSLNEVFDLMINKTAIVLIVILTVIGLSYRQRLYIDLENQRYRPTIETGPLKLGQWVNIKNPKYISVFKKGYSGFQTLYQVNLWFGKNRHINIFEMFDEEESMNMGFEVSEILNIDLLDATVHGDFKWIDKDKWRQQHHEPSEETTKQIRSKGSE